MSAAKGFRPIHLAAALCCCIAVALSLSHAETPAKVITAVRTTVPPTIDGFVDELQWQTAPAVLDFAQFDPIEGSLSTEITSVRILYDDHALYVGVICYDSRPKGIVRQLTRRDRNSEADRFTVQIDSYHDHQTAFVFSVNVSGVQGDGVLSQGGLVYDDTWDAVWRVNTRIYIDGWSAEFEIPYNALRFSEQDGSSYEWGVNFRRYISRKRETDEWVMVPRSERLLIPRWGHVKGIDNIRPPLNASIIPYVASKATFETATGVRPRSSEYTAEAGLDAKYGLTRNFTLDATINPDFGQVEVDKAVLNLTVFETNYPEKRPFFVEGAHLFAFGTSGVDNSSLPLFFSRRIGKRPALSSYVRSLPGLTEEENPQVTTILGAAKITGQTHSGFSLGAIVAATDKEDAVVRDAAGNKTTIQTEPRGSYNVARIRQELGGNSWVGGLAALTSRERTLPALSGGLDWNLKFAEGTYTLDGYLAGVRSSNAQLNRDGTSGKLLFAKIAAEHWLYESSYDYYSRYFNSNDLGFFAQPHDHGGHVAVDFRENFASSPFRRYSLRLRPQYRWNWDGVLTRAGVGAQFFGEFTTFWRVTMQYVFDAPAYDDAERGIIGTYRRPSAHEFWLNIESDQRGAISGSLTPDVQFDAKKKLGLNVLLSMTIRPASWVELNPMLYYERTRRQEAWLVPTGNVLDTTISRSPFSVFGDRDVDEVDAALRGTVTFTRTFSLQFFVQELIARGKYENYRRLVSSTQFLPYEYRSTPFFMNPDFNEITFNANVLLRWEYLPGSTLYLVWTQGRYQDSGNYETGFIHRFGDTFKQPHEDALALKVSYWLPL